MKIKYINHNPYYNIVKYGAWIDLAVYENESLSIGEEKVISLGISMELPKYYEAYVLPRSSTFFKYGLILGNSKGVIDPEYKGDEDIWGFIALSTRNIIIESGTRIAQFRIDLSMDAPWWAKLKWLFSKPKFVEVDHLGNNNRGGIGSTGN